MLVEVMASGRENRQIIVVSGEMSQPMSSSQNDKLKTVVAARVARFKFGPRTTAQDACALQTKIRHD